MDIDKFLFAHGLHPGGIDVDGIASAFAAEMAAGLAGRPSSLAMLPSHVPERRHAPAPGATAIVVDAGGTNLRVCRVVFDENAAAQIHDFTVRPMPGSGGAEVSADEFFAGIAASVAPLLDARQNAPVGFCFSYPARVKPDLDADVISLGKEVSVRGIEGMSLRKGLAGFLPNFDAAKIAVLNDTIGVLLGGSTAGADAGLIVGTGSNTAYYERGAFAFPMAVNVESGGFDKFPRGDIDREFDSASIRPGIGVFEKTFSGGYVGTLASLVLRAAGEEGISVFAPRKITAKEIDEILSFPLDTPTAWILDALYERAAKLLAANILGIMKHAGNPPAFKVCLEGSTIRKSKPLLAKFRAQLPGNIQFVMPEICVVTGTALAALTLTENNT